MAAPATPCASRAVREFVDPPGSKPLSSTSRGAPLADAASRHAFTRNRGRPIPVAIAHGQRVGCAVRVDRRIPGRRSTNRFIDQRGFRRALIDQYRHAHLVFELGDLRKIGPQEWRVDVELPPDPDQRVALLHEIAIAEVCGGRRITAGRRPVEPSQQTLAPAIGHFEEQHAVAARAVNRSKHVQVGREPDLPGGVTRRQSQVDDRRVAGIRWIERELNCADKLLVRSGLIRTPGRRATTVRDEIVTRVTSAPAGVETATSERTSAETRNLITPDSASSPVAQTRTSCPCRCR